MEFPVLDAELAGCHNFTDSINFADTIFFNQVTTPFIPLAPQLPRIVDIPYAAMSLPCVDVTDVSDVTDSTDQSDITDGGGGDVVI